MKKSDIIDIIQRRHSEHIRTMQKYQSGYAHDRAAACRHELFDILLEIERTEEEQKEQRRLRRRAKT